MTLLMLECQVNIYEAVIGHHYSASSVHIYFLVIGKDLIKWASNGEKRKFIKVVDLLNVTWDVLYTCNSICSAARIFAQAIQGQQGVVLDSITTLYDTHCTHLYIDVTVSGNFSPYI